VGGFIMAKQARCSTFYIDYGGPGINISELLEPHPGIYDWRVPTPGFSCPKDDPTCTIAWQSYARGGGPNFREIRKQLTLAAVPNYRNPYGEETSYKQNQNFRGMKGVFGDDFELESSMACAMGSMLSLSRSAVKFQPNLFTTILPTLRDPNALVLSVYIRSGQTERFHHEELVEKYQEQAKAIAGCAIQVEEEMLAKEQNQNQVVVWMLVTDSQYVKTFITDTYSSPNRRTILTTQSRGAHTKTRNNEPSTADFAEAFLDWYLIGESDAVIADHRAPSFGNTATFRTARPYYKVPKEGGRCTRVEPTYK
jgi:hypothetical protein